MTRSPLLVGAILLTTACALAQCVSETGEGGLGSCWCEGTAAGVEISSFGDMNSQTVLTTPENYRVAFFGDQFLGTNANNVMQLIVDEGAQAVVHSGDFDYYDNPDAWDALIDTYFEKDFPYFSSIGNHDLPAWISPNGGYQAKIKARMDVLAESDHTYCQGVIGAKQVCIHRGILILNSGSGTLCSTETWLSETLETHKNISLKFCQWHKNQHDMQLGSKTNEVGWGPYEACRAGGAVVATGHEHSYSRTHLLSSMEHKDVVQEAEPGVYDIDNGNSIVWVSGLAGRGIRNTIDDAHLNPWWASAHYSTNGANYGSVFCDFNVGGDPGRGDCYFKTVNGVVLDSFSVRFPYTAPDLGDDQGDESGLFSWLPIGTLLAGLGGLLIIGGLVVARGTASSPPSLPKEPGLKLSSEWDNDDVGEETHEMFAEKDPIPAETTLNDRASRDSKNRRRSSRSSRSRSARRTSKTSEQPTMDFGSRLASPVSGHQEGLEPPSDAQHLLLLQPTLTPPASPRRVYGM